VDPKNLRNLFLKREEIKKILKSKLDSKIEEIKLTRKIDPNNTRSMPLLSLAKYTEKIPFLSQGQSEKDKEEKPLYEAKWGDFKDELTNIEDLLDEIENTEFNFIR